MYDYDELHKIVINYEHLYNWMLEETNGINPDDDIQEANEMRFIEQNADKIAAMIKD